MLKSVGIKYMKFVELIQKCKNIQSMHINKRILSSSIAKITFAKVSIVHNDNRFNPILINISEAFLSQK